jgi:hypothetical protein
MKKQDFNLYTDICHKIIEDNLTPTLCGVCFPPCLEYAVLLNGVKYEIEFISGNKIVTIQQKHEFESQIILSIKEIEFYKTNKDLLK